MVVEEFFGSRVECVYVFVVVDDDDGFYSGLEESFEEIVVGRYLSSLVGFGEWDRFVC